MKTISIDLGGSNVKMGVVEDGKVLQYTSIRSNSGDGLMPLLPEIERVCRAWCAEHAVVAIGFAFPSLVDVKEKRILGHNGKFPDYEQIDLEHWVRDRFDLPMFIDNDAAAAALGEGHYGSAADTDDFVLMILGTGIGAAACMDGQLLRGKHYQAVSMFGHIPLKVDGRSCAGCPGVGCAEAQASTWALQHMVEESPLDSPLKAEETVDFKCLKRYYDRQDPLAVAIFEECCAYWANCLIAMVYAYDPEVVVLSGGVIQWGAELTDRLAQVVEQRAWTPWGKLQFRLAHNPEQSVLLGLHALCMEGL